MSEKKQPGRFTLQFNLADPQQRMASEVLEKQGRRKAQFLANAVLHYIQQPAPEKGGTSTSSLNEDVLKQLMLTVIKTEPQVMTAAPTGKSRKEPAPPEGSPVAGAWDTPPHDDALRAITETLAAFQNG